MRKEILFDDLLKKIPNKYMLTLIAGKRAREIMGGAEPYCEVGAKDTLIRKVLIEIMDNQIGIEDGEE